MNLRLVKYEKGNNKMAPLCLDQVLEFVILFTE